jgi:hypothetical protein
MRSWLGPVNLALISIYFAPVWGREAARALVSPYNGFEDRAHAAASIFFRQAFDLNLNGLILTSSILAGIKLVIAAGFFVYLIEFARSVVTRRQVNRETMDVVLTLAFAGIVIWALPAMASADGALIQLQATQLLMVVGAIVVVTIERHLEKPQQALTRAETVALERAASIAAVTGGELRGAPVPVYTTRRLQG